MDGQQRELTLGMLAYAVHRGVAAHKICEASDLDLDMLMRDGNHRITGKQTVALWKNITELCNDPLFGLHFGESLQLQALGAVGEIIKNSNTIGEAITIAASMTHLVTSLFTMNVIKSNKHFTVCLTPKSKHNDPFLERQLADLLLIFTIHELDGLVLEKITPNKVEYPRKVTDHSEYHRVFRQKINVGATYAVSFDSKLWDLPIIVANYEMQRYYLQKLNGQFVNGELSKPFEAKVFDYLMANSFLGILSLDDVAANFNMTPRTLQRKLQERNTTFQQLADSARRSMAIHFLESGKYQVKEISTMLGYNELSAFSRAFKRWTGKSPVSYQA